MLGLGEKIRLRDLRVVSLSLVFLVVCGSLVLPGKANGAAADDENCLMCHKHRGNSRIDINGRKRLFYVNEVYFSRSVHGRVPCRDCHWYIQQIPHKVITNHVNCGVQCHVKNPSTGRNFSHRPVYEFYKTSVHGGDPDPDKPVCKRCHRNPLYTREASSAVLVRGGGVMNKRIKPVGKKLNRCVSCHEVEDWATTYYLHVSHRLMDKTFRNKLQIVELCSSCHADEEKMKRHGLSEIGLQAVETYKMTYHWKRNKHGMDDGATCIDCHSRWREYTHAVHDIRRKVDPKSTINPKNKLKTCGQEDCHTSKLGPIAMGGLKANENFVSFDVHLNPEEPLDAAGFITAESFFFLTFVNVTGVLFIMTLMLIRRIISWFIGY